MRIRLSSRERKWESPPSPPPPACSCGLEHTCTENTTDQTREYAGSLQLQSTRPCQPCFHCQRRQPVRGGTGERSQLTHLRAPRLPCRPSRQRRPAPRWRAARSRSSQTGCPWPCAPGSGWAQTSPPPPAASSHSAGAPGLAAGSGPRSRTLLPAPASDPAPQGSRRPGRRPSWLRHVAVAGGGRPWAGVSSRALAASLSCWPRPLPLHASPFLAST